MVKSKIYQLRKYMAVTSSFQYDDNYTIYILTIATDLFSIKEKRIDFELISYEFYKDGDFSQEPIEYGARLEYDENDNDYWRCYTQIPAFEPSQINSGGSYDPLEAVLIAFEQDMYL